MGFSRQEYWSGVSLPSPTVPCYRGANSALEDGTPGWEVFVCGGGVLPGVEGGVALHAGVVPSLATPEPPRDLTGPHPAA